MALVINTNIGSIQAERALATTRGGMETSMQRLASGKRINSAHDDAAGIAVAARMQDQIQGLNVAIRNANDGVGIAQTAEGAIEEMQNVLHRMRELAVQAANGTYTAEDRGFLNLEYVSLMSELHRTSIATTWDQDMKLLDEDVGSVDIQVGTSAAMTINIPIGPLTTRALGLKTNKEDLGTAAAGTSSTSATTTYTMSFGGTAGTFTPGDDYELTINGVRLTAEDATSIEDVATKLSADYDLKSTGIKSIAMVGTTTKTLVVTWLDSAQDATTKKGPVATLKWSKDTTSINTITGANDAMGYLDNAQQLANAQRSKLGAAMNRIQYTVNNLLNIVQNTQEAKSRIFDTDYAAESAALAKAKVLAEAGTAMLAQANQSQQYVMNLLRGGG